uniref:Mitochondrial translation release factor 1 like n=1 Tax=Bos indicus x Bos taurus TaxID=30522 RepID=A0A4W2GC43_BOBOX
MVNTSCSYLQSSHLGTAVAEMRKRQQSQNEETPAVSQAPGNQRPNNTCCFCWCCCCSCSCLTVRNEERGENAGRPTHTTKMESIQVLEECQNPTSDEVLSWSQNFDKMMKAPAGRNLFREFLRTEYSEENLLFWLACEDLKKEQNKKVIEEKARMIYDDYISILSPKEINLVINPKDLRIDTKRASGAGGQHVNTTDSAVRIVHLPTGIVSECQQERSQLKNKEMAMKKLRAKLYSLQLEEETSKRYNARKIQIGTKGRSEKIRTYNFPQNRVTDHRINKSLHDLETFMQGEYLLDELVQSLKDYANYESLVEIIAKEV